MYMPPKEVRETAGVFINKAKLDFGTIEEMKDSGEEYDPVLGYHAQQAIEKAIKSVMVYSGMRIPRIHNLRTLANLCVNEGIRVPEISISLERLTRYAIEDRYFDPVEDESELLDRTVLIRDVNEFIGWASAIVDDGEID